MPKPGISEEVQTDYIGSHGCPPLVLTFRDLSPKVVEVPVEVVKYIEPEPPVPVPTSTRSVQVSVFFSTTLSSFQTDPMPSSFFEGGDGGTRPAVADDDGYGIVSQLCVIMEGPAGQFCAEFPKDSPTNQRLCS